MFVQWGWVRSDNLTSDVGVQVCESNTLTTKFTLRPKFVLHDVRPVGVGLAFTRYCITSKLYWGSQSSFHCPPHLQSIPYCITFARPLRSIRPPTDPSFGCHTPYNIGDGNLVPY